MRPNGILTRARRVADKIENEFDCRIHVSLSSVRRNGINYVVSSNQFPGSFNCNTAKEARQWAQEQSSRN